MQFETTEQVVGAESEKQPPSVEVALASMTLVELAESGIQVDRLDPGVIRLLFPNGSSDPEVSRTIANRMAQFQPKERLLNSSGVALTEDEVTGKQAPPLSDHATPNASHF